MTVNEVVSRARHALAGGGCKYALGMGGFNPAAPVPWNSRGECDCSGFVAWCLNISRRLDNPWYVSFNGGWLETTVIERDALGPFGFFNKLDLEWDHLLPGCLVVYGDRRIAGGLRLRQGHVGVVATATSVIHCSSGNYKRTGNAIQETGPEIWQAKKGLIAQCAWVT